MKLWQEAQAIGNQDALAPHWISLGPVTIDTGQVKKIEVRLPAQWGQ
jgi:hypothetical protein